MSLKDIKVVFPVDKILFFLLCSVCIACSDDNNAVNELNVHASTRTTAVNSYLNR